MLMFSYAELCLYFFQESIAKAIEEKISGEQRRYLLNEQLKAIKKVCLLLPSAHGICLNE